jgi:hypothetical protein
MTNSLSQAAILASLRRSIEHAQRAPKAGADELVSSGCRELDQALPAGGFVPGTLIEWLASGPGSAASMLSLLVARQACLRGGAVVVLDRAGQFYPPAAAAWGIDLERLILIRAANSPDELWALDQALRCAAVSAVWVVLDKLDARSFRRVQLAAEVGGGLGLLVRPVRVRGQPTWSDMQILVEPLPGHPSSDPHARRTRVQVVRCRGHHGGNAIEMEIDARTGQLRKASHAPSSPSETCPLSVAAPVAHSKDRRPTARA